MQIHNIYMLAAPLTLWLYVDQVDSICVPPLLPLVSQVARQRQTAFLWHKPIFDYNVNNTAVLILSAGM